MTTHPRTRRPSRASRHGLAALALAAVALTTGCLPGSAVSEDGVISACADSKGAIRLLDKAGGASCPGGQMLVEWDQHGAPSPGTVLGVGAVSGIGLNPTPTLNRLGLHLAVDVAPGAVVQMTATKVVGTHGSDNFAQLDTWACHRPAGSTSPADYQVVGEKSRLIVRRTGRVPVSITTVFDDLPAGSHEIGLCSFSEQFTRWNDSDASHVSAMVIAGG